MLLCLWRNFGFGFKLLFRFVQIAFGGSSKARFWFGSALDQDHVVGIQKVRSHVWKGESSEASAFHSPLPGTTITPSDSKCDFSSLLLTVRREPRRRAGWWRRIRSSGTCSSLVVDTTDLFIVMPALITLTRFFWFVSLFVSLWIQVFLLNCSDVYSHQNQNSLCCFIFIVGWVWMDQWCGTAAPKPVRGNAHLGKYSTKVIIKMI